MTDLTRTRFKELLGLHRSRERREQGLVLVPGFKCLEELVGSPWEIRGLLVTDEARELLPASVIRRLGGDANILRMHASDAARLADQPSPEGVIAVAEVPATLEDPAFQLAGGGPRVVLDGLSDPGNLGSVIRTAAWFGLGRLLLLGASADVGSIKVLRASMGAVFRLDSVVRAEQGISARPAVGGRWIGLDAGGEASLSDFRFRPGDVIVLGGESHGLDASRPFLDLTLSIPGAAPVESLNAGHAFAAVAWEQFRQGRND